MKKVQFSANCCFAFDNSKEDKHCLNILAKYLMSKGMRLAFYGHGRFFQYLLDNEPRLKEHIRFIIAEGSSLSSSDVRDIPAISVENLPDEVKTVFLCETKTFPRMQMRKKLAGKKITIVSPDILTELDYKAIPLRGWIPYTENIYREQFDLPEIEFLPCQDMILIDCPSRNLSLMPNGLAYVHNALKKTGIKFQTVDLDIIVYHRYHIYRLFDTSGKVLTPSGKEMPDDPWMAEKMEFWEDPDVIEFFREDIKEIIYGLVKAHPRILSLSIQQCNTKFSTEIVAGVKKKLPDTIILTGGYSCYLPHIGLRAFPLSDYMVIGEADLIVSDLVKRLVNGKRPQNLPGVVSRFDIPGKKFVPGRIPYDLDVLDFPKYDWIDLNCYRNYSHYRLTPITGSRGCHWGRCRFCGEARLWRGRHPKKFVDELEWLYDHGCDLFVFNESDMNSDPELLKEICREVVRRKLNVRLSGQLRIDKRNTQDFFELLRQAGFICLRFGVDGWSEHALRLQNKGYNTQLVSQNLKDCWKAGLPAEVNAVVGVPMETDDDIKESIDIMLQHNKYIWRLANINQLVLLTGSIYWKEPEKYNIHFRGNKEEIYKNNLFHIPSELWYSTEPYIDSNVRLERCKRILRELKKNGFDFGPGAEPKVEDYLEKMESVDAQNSQKKTEILPETGNAATTVGVHETSQIKYLVVKHKNNFYMINTDAAHNKDTVIAKKRFSIFSVVFRKIASLAKDSAIRRAYINRIKYRLHVIYQERGVTGTLLFVFQKLMEKYRRYLDPVSLAGPVLPMNMVKENVRGYNLIKVCSDYYAIKHGYPFDTNKLDADSYEKGICFMAPNIRLLEEQVNKYCDDNLMQKMIRGNYKGYNIIEVEHLFYGVKHGYFFNKRNIDDAKYEDGRFFKAESAEKVERLISDYVSKGSSRDKVSYVNQDK